MTKLYPPINDCEFGLHLADCLERDDKEKFVRICKEFRAETWFNLSKEVLLSNAKKCIEAYLTGEAFWDGSPRVMSKYMFGLFLYLSTDPHVAKLLMEKSNAKEHLNSVPSGQVHPISYLLHSTCVDTTTPVANWFIGDSLIKKREMETLRILATHTDKLNEVACTQVKEWGEVKRLAALLLVAQGKVIAPLDTGMTIRDYFANEAAAARADQDKCTNHYTEAIKLLELFERAGDALSIYYASLAKSCTVKKAMTGVVDIYKELGFTLTEKDLDFLHYSSPRSRVAKKYCPPQEYSSNPYFNASASSNSSSQTFVTAYSTSQSNMNRRGKSRKQGAGSLWASASSQTSIRAFCTSQMDGSIKKDGNLLIARQPAPSVKFLAYVALNLKKGIKFL